MAATVLGGFWEVNGVLSMTTVHTTSALKRRISQNLGKKQTYALRKIMETLNGVAAGQTATKTLTRVIAAEELGGVRAIQTETLVSRVTTTADRTDITADLLTFATKGYDSTPPANLDDNPLGTR